MPNFSATLGSKISQNPVFGHFLKKFPLVVQFIKSPRYAGVILCFCTGSYAAAAAAAATAGRRFLFTR